MKRILPLVLTLLSYLITSSVNSQVVVASTDGYMVNINVKPVAIVPGSSSCQYGYNYNLRIEYTISFSGTNRPSGLYTLQGTIGCGSNTHFFDLPNNIGTGTVTSGSNVWTGRQDCATATVASLSCNLIVIEIEGPGISHRNVSAPLNTSSATLPIRLVSFNAVPSSNGVKIKWTTASEENNDYFTIERSANAHEWNAIKTVKGAGNSYTTLNYEAVDANPLTGISYYRLRQTDFDGNTTYSSIVSIENNSNAATISLFPVPNAGNIINLRGISNYSENELNLLNSNGAVLHRATLTKSSVELPAIKPGIYIILIKNKVSGESTSIRYVKI